MLNKIIVLLFIINLTFKVATAKPIEEDESFIENLNYKYENGKWTCHDVECPADTIGCRIRLRTAEDDRTVLYQSFTCLDKDMHAGGAGDRIVLAKPKNINIYIETFIGAKTVYSNGYDREGGESAIGEIGVNDLNRLKESAKKMKNTFTHKPKHLNH